MEAKKLRFRGKRIDNQEWVKGYYFVTPLTDENSGTNPDVGHFFLCGEQKHCISNETGVVFVVIPESIELLIMNDSFMEHLELQYQYHQDQEKERADVLDYHQATIHSNKAAAINDLIIKIKLES